MTQPLDFPCKFQPNRVRRLYHGGSGIDRLRGISPAEDTRYPEEWIASCIDGNGREFHSPNHGVSQVELEGESVYFPELLERHADEILGSVHVQAFGENPAVLTKLLDSSVRLPLQVHPTKEDARRFFQFGYGKTEAWIILETREIKGETPHVLLGFNETLDEAVFRHESVMGEYVRGLEMLHKIPVRKGDVIVVYGGLPHAIGPGVTMVEVMEPTDWVLIPERECFGIQLSEEKRFAGLPPETALEMFDFRRYTREDIIRRCCPAAREIRRAGASIHHSLIRRREVGFFEAQSLQVCGSWEMDLSERSFRVCIAVEGKVTLSSGEKRIALSAGDSCFLPYTQDQCRIDGEGKILIILPPASGHA